MSDIRNKENDRKIEYRRVLIVSGVMMLCMLSGIYGCAGQDDQKLPNHIQALDNMAAYSADAKPAHQITLQQETTFGDTEEVLVGEYGAVAVDDGGRVFIADRKQQDIKVYRADGRLLQRLGGMGKGPGEYQNVGEMAIRSDAFYVRDGNLQRMIVYSLDSLALRRTISLAPDYNDKLSMKPAYPGQVYPLSGGTFLMGFTHSDFNSDLDEWDSYTRRETFYRLNEEGDITSDSLFTLRASINVMMTMGPRTIGMPSLLRSEGLITVGSDGQIYTAWSEEFLVKVWSPDGRYERAIYYPMQAAVLTGESAVEAEIPEVLVDNMGKMELPETWPRLDTMLADDQGRLWIATITEDMDSYRWRVLDNEGKWLAAFNWPRSREIKAVQDNAVYALEEDPGTGVQQVVRYRMHIQ